MKEEQIDEIVVQKSQMRPGETLGMAMNRLTGKTAVKGGANDPTSSKFKGPASSSAAGQLAKSGISDMSSGSGAMRTLPNNLAGRNQSKDAAVAASSERGIRSYSQGNVDVSKFNAPGGNRATSIPSSTDSTPTTPVASTGAAAPGPTTGDSRQKTSTSVAPNSRMVAESVQIGENKYRII